MDGKKKNILTCQEFPSVLKGKKKKTEKRSEFSVEFNRRKTQTRQCGRGCTQKKVKSAAGCTKHARSDTKHAVIVWALRMTALFVCQISYCCHDPEWLSLFGTNPLPTAPLIHVHKCFRFLCKKKKKGWNDSQKNKNSSNTQKKNCFICLNIIIITFD